MPEVETTAAEPGPKEINMSGTDEDKAAATQLARKALEAANKTEGQIFDTTEFRETLQDAWSFLTSPDSPVADQLNEAVRMGARLYMPTPVDGECELRIAFPGGDRSVAIASFPLDQVVRETPPDGDLECGCHSDAANRGTSELEGRDTHLPVTARNEKADATASPQNPKEVPNDQ